VRQAVGPSFGPPLYMSREEVDPGFVFLFVRSNNPVWWPVIFNSVVKHFTGAQFTWETVRRLLGALFWKLLARWLNRARG
jgi:hypothetical protein